MSAARILRKIAAFFWRDFQIARGYRMALLAQTVEEFFGSTRSRRARSSRNGSATSRPARPSRP